MVSNCHSNVCMYTLCLGLSTGALGGIIIIVLLLLLIIVLVAYARSRGKWCFAGKPFTHSLLSLYTRVHVHSFMDSCTYDYAESSSSHCDLANVHEMVLRRLLYMSMPPALLQIYSTWVYLTQWDCTHHYILVIRFCASSCTPTIPFSA